MLKKKSSLTKEQIEKIRLAKERERDAFLELRARKREEAEELKFANAQTIFERKFDELDRFEERKGILSSRAKKEDAAKIKKSTDVIINKRRSKNFFNLCKSFFVQNCSLVKIRLLQ